MLKLADYEVLSFDCYGTLIDWESGLLTALEPALTAHGLTVPDQTVLELFARLETRETQSSYRPYAEILGDVMAGLGRELGFTPTGPDLGLLADSLADWPVFADTREALAALAARYRLAIISNIDDALFAHSARRLGVSFDWVVTAQQVRSYKPSVNNFQQALARFGVPRERVLHVAQSLFHDIGPAASLGLSTVWVNRRKGRPGSGATPAAAARPDLEVPDLRSLAVAAGVL